MFISKGKIRLWKVQTPYNNGFWTYIFYWLTSWHAITGCVLTLWSTVHVIFMCKKCCFTNIGVSNVEIRCYDLKNVSNIIHEIPYTGKVVRCFIEMDLRPKRPQKRELVGDVHKTQHQWMPGHTSCTTSTMHDDVLKCALLAFVLGIHPSPVNSPHKGQWRGALMFSFIWDAIALIMTSLQWNSHIPVLHTVFCSMEFV